MSVGGAAVEQAPSYWGTWLLATAMVAVTAPRHCGVLVVFWLVLFLVGLVYALVVIILRPARRKGVAIRLGIWVGGFLVIAAVHVAWAKAARRDADHVVALVIDYKARQGKYPKQLADLGLDKQQLRRRWLLVYLDDTPAPFLSYDSTFDVFDGYVYDFRKEQWTFVPD